MWQRYDAMVGPGDLTGDGVPDLLARESATGALWLHRRTAGGGWGAAVRLGIGWGGMDALVGPGDLTGDGRPDLLARRGATLWLYPGNGAGRFSARVALPTPSTSGTTAARGWSTYDAFSGPGDVDGDGRADLLARETSSGRLVLFAGTAAAPPARVLLARRVVGTGWAAFDRLP